MFVVVYVKCLLCLLLDLKMCKSVRFEPMKSHAVDVSERMYTALVKVGFGHLKSCVLKSFIGQHGL